MKPPEYLDVDPRTLRVPHSRATGADPYKLVRQTARFGTSQAGMPPPLVIRCKDGLLLLNDGVTRATRIAKYAHGPLIRVAVTGEWPKYDASTHPAIGDTLP